MEGGKEGLFAIKGWHFTRPLPRHPAETVWK